MFEYRPPPQIHRYSLQSAESIRRTPSTADAVPLPQWWRLGGVTLSAIYTPCKIHCLSLLFAGCIRRTPSVTASRATSPKGGGSERGVLCRMPPPQIHRYSLQSAGCIRRTPSVGLTVYAKDVIGTHRSGETTNAAVPVFGKAETPPALWRRGVQPGGKNGSRFCSRHLPQGWRLEERNVFPRLLPVRTEHFRNFSASQDVSL